MSKQRVTFKDWLRRRFPGMEITRAQPEGSVAAVMMEALEEAWDTSAVIEREECALACEKAGAGAAAKAIRERSRK